MDHPQAHESDVALWDDESHLPDFEDISVASASGVFLTERSGRRLLDAASGHSCVNLGYANGELIATAAESYRRLAYCSPEHRCEPVAALAQKLSDRLGGGYRLRFATNGGGANELAIEIARRHWLNLGRPQKRAVIALDRAYHGSTGLASFASGPGVLQSPLAERGGEFSHVVSARDPATGLSRDLPRLRHALQERIAKLGADRTAAVMVEPLAFAGGVVVPPDGFLEMVAEVCRSADILLIVDEVITGFGRSGSFFAFQQAKGVRPDIVTMGKGITSAYFPLAAAAVDEAIYRSFLQPGHAMAKLITMAGHPVGCDIALKVIEIMERDGLVERVKRNESRLAGLRALTRLPFVRDVRGRGHMWGIEFDDAGPRSGAELARQVSDRCLDQGLLVLRAQSMIRLNPPLVIAPDELDFVVATLSAAVEAAA